MRYVVDRMTLADIPRVTEVERLAYPTPWPPSAYRKELQDNPLAHYIVLRDSTLESTLATVSPGESSPRRPFPLSLLPARSQINTSPHVAAIVGFAGLWLMVDEAHITTIALHPDYRGRGLGELMLEHLIGIASDIHAHSVTLEVRVSNSVAQNLYRKYGFHEAGIRRRYYSDNHEDAKIMWIDDITSADYHLKYATLKDKLQQRLQAESSGQGAERGGATGVS